jgi:hypothetical protein
VLYCSEQLIEFLGSCERNRDNAEEGDRNSTLEEEKNTDPRDQLWITEEYSASLASLVGSYFFAFSHIC